MKIGFQPPQSGIYGYALTITIMFLAVVLVIFASILYWAESNATMTVRNNQYNMSENAAEAAVETVIGRIDRDFVNGSISNASAYASLPATIDQSTWPVQYIFSATNGSTGAVSVAISPTSSSTVPLNSQYTGLYGLAQSVDVYATATPIGQLQTVPATVHEALQYATIPLFQYAIFYNVNLEICPGATMNITGPVFCNQSIWEGSGNAVFSSTVAAVGTNCSLQNNPFALNYGPQTPPSTFRLAGQPVDHANPVVMPIGTNNSPGAVMSLLQLPPADYAMGTAAAYSSNGIVYPANAADLVISNAVFGTNDLAAQPTGTNYIVYFQDPSTVTLTPLPYDYYRLKVAAQTGFTTNYVSPNLSDTNRCYTNVAFAGMSWLTNAVFYDWREGGTSGSAKRVEAVQIDIAKFTTWLSNTAKNGGADASGVNPDPTKMAHSGHHIGGIYVFNSVALTSYQMPAVRVVNGAQLPNPWGTANPYGLTVATQFPIYVLGNYNSQTSAGSSLGTTNTTFTIPAALMGDSITILSTNWSDGYTSLLPTGSTHGPGDTTVNAAALEGIVQTVPTISGDYSGGVENFLRLLEDWPNGIPSGKRMLTYNGSIVVLFYSQWATNHWHGGAPVYYNPPNRNWAFDLNFQNANKLPPMTPCIRAMVRGNWYAHK